MTRTYERQTIRYPRSTIDQLEAEGRAVYFPGLPGYVLDKKVPVRNHQILEDEAPADLDLSMGVYDNDWKIELGRIEAEDRHRNELVEYERKAAAEGISVGEYTDGEYESFGPDSAAEAALLAKFGL